MNLDPSYHPDVGPEHSQVVVVEAYLEDDITIESTLVLLRVGGSSGSQSAFEQIQYRQM